MASFQTHCLPLSLERVKLTSVIGFKQSTRWQIRTPPWVLSRIALLSVRPLRACLAFDNLPSLGMSNTLIYQQSSEAPELSRSDTDINLAAQRNSFAALERRSSNGGTVFEELSIPDGCIEVVISRDRMDTRLGMKLKSGGQQRQPFIDELEPDSLAAKNDLEVGDIICWVNEEQANGAQHVADIMRTHLKLRLIVRKGGDASKLRLSTAQ